MDMRAHTGGKQYCTLGFYYRIAFAVEKKATPNREHRRLCLDGIAGRGRSGCLRARNCRLLVDFFTDA